jgi:hypothetical protein
MTHMLLAVMTGQWGCKQCMAMCMPCCCGIIHHDLWLYHIVCLYCQAVIHPDALRRCVADLSRCRVCTRVIFLLLLFTS